MKDQYELSPSTYLGRTIIPTSIFPTCLKLRPPCWKPRPPYMKSRPTCWKSTENNKSDAKRGAKANGFLVLRTKVKAMPREANFEQKG